ncbi:potassium channel subfamily K member 2 [Striga asiatica]|uniref:Potassium channel subfamily K member 2 n=1 Tax=Striga asiatica TaxID=4170 RepID=A0A5A7PIK6_STRAF|nr:potassium channel subfamily K member 2 [Striga asiatica]
MKFFSSSRFSLSPATSVRFRRATAISEALSAERSGNEGGDRRPLPRPATSVPWTQTAEIRTTIANLRRRQRRDKHLRPSSGDEPARPASVPATRFPEPSSASRQLRSGVRRLSHQPSGEGRISRRIRVRPFNLVQ